MGGIAVDVWNFGWLWTFRRLSLIPKVFFLIKIHLEFSRNLTYQKRYLHFSIDSKRKQIFKPLSLFYNLKFRSTPLHSTKQKMKFSRESLIRTSVKVICNFLDTLRLVQELSGFKQTILMWKHCKSITNLIVASKVQSQLKDHTSTVISAAFAQLHVAPSTPFVGYVFLSSRNLYWC